MGEDDMEKTILDRFNQWMAFDEDTRRELMGLTDEEDIHDRFYKNLEFGTGGLRGVMGAGTNRINGYTVRRVTFGLAKFFKATMNGRIKVAIAYDSRNLSKQFAAEAASVLCASGIQAALFQTLMPTPVLSFAVRYLCCQAGIVITASHNPKEYNGYKVYNQSGCQILPDEAKKIVDYINTVEDYLQIPVMDLDAALNQGLFQWIGNPVMDEYLSAVRKQSIYHSASPIKVVYSPLHGTGNIPVRAVLDRFNISVVTSQESPDGNFSTVRSPNPEERDALQLGIEQARREDADLVLGTDPDCDRVGVAVRHENDYVLLTGNQIGALLVDFVTSKRSAKNNPALVKTIVTSELGATIGRSRGLMVDDTLTGFKYIGDKINQYEKNGDITFVIGYEESYGYLVGTHARDKDAVVSSMLIVEMAAWHHDNGKTLVDALNGLYEEFGFYLDALVSITLQGADGARKIQNIMSGLRTDGKTLIQHIREVQDYLKGIDGLPAENVLKFILADDSWFAVRPSGTEPKIKIYYSIKDSDRKIAQERLEEIQAFIHDYIMRCQYD